MPSQSITINRPVSEVYNYLIEQFSKSFKVDKTKLKDASITSTIERTAGKLKLQQKVTNLIENELIEFTSSNDLDISFTQYKLKEVEGKTILEYTEEITSTKFFRKLNYKLFSWPFFNKYAKSRLNTVLENIKRICEEEQQ